MPWEKSFDEEVAIDKAMQVFWQKGFESTSINDLLDVTELNRGSFYNAFKSKRQLFEKALVKYDIIRQGIVKRLDTIESPKEKIDLFFDIAVSRTSTDPDLKGCFLFNTSLELAAHDHAVNEIVSNNISEIEHYLYDCIESGQGIGEIPKSLDPDATAKSLLALVVSIYVLGRGVYKESELQAIADQAKRLIS